MKLRIRFIDLDTVDCTADPHPVGFKAAEELLAAVLRVFRSPLLLGESEESRQWMEAEIAKLRERLVRGEKNLRLEIGVEWTFAGSSACSDMIEIDLDRLNVNFSNTDWFCERENYLAHLKDLAELTGCKDVMYSGLAEVTQHQHWAVFINQEALCESLERVCASDLVKGIQKVHLTLGSKEYKTDYYSSFAGKLATGPYAEKHKVAGLYFFMDMEEQGVGHLPPGLTGLREALKVLQAHRGEEQACLVVDVLWCLRPELEGLGRIHVEGHVPQLEKACFAVWVRGWGEDWLYLDERLFEIIGGERLKKVSNVWQEPHSSDYFEMKIARSPSTWSPPVV